MITPSHISQTSLLNKGVANSSSTPRYLAKSLLALTVVLSLASCSNEQQVTSDTTANKSETSTTGSGDVLRIGTEGAYAPFNYTNTDGTLGGFDVELATALCANMKVTCEIIAQDWDGIIPGLKAGKYDAIIAAMSITPERAAQVNFTEPYFSNTLVFLAKKDSRFDPNNRANIDENLIAAQRSTISSQWLEKAYPKAKIKLYDTLSNAFLDLGSGRVDAMISDKVPALQWLNSSSGSSYVIKGNEIDINDNFAIAVRPGDELQNKLNQALTNIKADGTYEKLNQRYFALASANESMSNAKAMTGQDTIAVSNTGDKVQ